jgi:hypothetical protein
VKKEGHSYCTYYAVRKEIEKFAQSLNGEKQFRKETEKFVQKKVKIQQECSDFKYPCFKEKII